MAALQGLKLLLRSGGSEIDAAIDVSLLEAGVLERYGDSAAEHVQDVQLKVGAEGFREPDARYDAHILHIEAEAGKINTQDAADEKRQLSRHFGEYINGLKFGLID